MIENPLTYFSQGLVAATFDQAEVLSRAQSLMELASGATGATAVIHLCTAEDLFRRLQDGASAAATRSLLIRTRVAVACEGLLHALVTRFESDLEDACQTPPAAHESHPRRDGPKEAVPYFRLVLEEARSLSAEEKWNYRLDRLLQAVHQFVQKAEARLWDQMGSWPSLLLALNTAATPEARAGLHLFGAWLKLRKRDFSHAVEDLGAALRLLPRNEGLPRDHEIAGRLHYFMGFLLTLSPEATMKNLQDACLHFRDARTSFERAGQGAEWLRHLLARTYERLARDHTEGNPLLRTHYEDQAFQARMSLEPPLPMARVIVRPEKGNRGWWSRLWRG
jgi:hypothetical protein